MNHLEEVKSYLVAKKKTLDTALTAARLSRDNAPSAMESHSDTTRDQNEKLVFALEEKIKELDIQISSIPQKVIQTNTIKLWHYVELETSDRTTTKVFFVPTGMGGAKKDETLFLSIDTPLAAVLINKQLSDKIQFNDKEYTVTKID